MHRTQVLLTEEQAQRLRKEAARRGVSMAEIIREALKEHLISQQRRELRRRALAVVGRFASGRRTVSAEHDRELEEAYADALVQRRLGLEAVRALHQDLLPVVEILPVDEALHQAAVETLLASRSRSVSLSRSGELLPHAAAGDSDRFRLRPGFPA